jgi:hypothetical protein
MNDFVISKRAFKLGAVGAAVAISASVSGTAFATTPTMYFWSQGEATQTLPSWHSDLCVLSGFQGDFAGTQEAVTLSTGSDGNWHLGGASATTGVNGVVSCVPWSAFTGSFTGVKLSGNWSLVWNGGPNNGTVQTNLWGADSWCGVRSMSGAFTGDLQDVAIFQSGSTWVFQVDAYSSQINGGAGCAGFDWSTATTAKVSPMFTVDSHTTVVDLPPTDEALCGLTIVAGIYQTEFSSAFVNILAGNSQVLENTDEDPEGDGEVASAQCLYYAQP